MKADSMGAFHIQHISNEKKSLYFLKGTWLEVENEVKRRGHTE
jgi:hypothetical protein